MSSEHGWSAARNWDGELVPSLGEPVGLEFPHLSGCSGACYSGENDLTGLQVESIRIDDGDEYELGGKEIGLGSGGMTIAPAAGTSGPAGDVIGFPIRLSASQRWTIAGRSGGEYGENGAAVFGDLAGGPSDLTISIGGGTSLLFGSEAELGPVTLEGADTAEAGVLNGFVELIGDLDFLDGNPVNLDHMFMIGSGAVGALQTDHGALDVGDGIDPAEGVLADSATFDGSGEVGFQIVGEGETEGEDYSQLESVGDVQLSGAEIAVHVSPPLPRSNVCPTLRPGQTYTLLATQGTLSGAFSNAPEGGPEISLEFAKRCSQPEQTMRIEYHRSGALQTVTGTIDAELAERERHEEQERLQHQEQTEREQRELEETRKRQENSEREHQQTVERETAEAAARAWAVQVAAETAKKEAELAAVKRQEEVFDSEHAQLAGATTLASSVLIEQHGRRVSVKLTCKGPGACSGKLLLKSLGRRAKQIGTAVYEAPSGRAVTVTVPLDAAGRSLLRAARDRLRALLTIESEGRASQRTRVRLEPAG
jgi:hypothetical protein